MRKRHSVFDPDPIVSIAIDVDITLLFYMIFSEPMAGFSPNLQEYVSNTCLRVERVLVTLTSFSRSGQGE